MKKSKNYRRVYGFKSMLCDALFTHKRFFPMTPIHHTFEKIGWEEKDIVKLFWIIGLIGSTIGIIYGVWI